MKKAFLPIADADSTILILGTMPGEKSLELQEYYGNRGNQFWKLLYTIFGKELSLNYEDRKRLLKENNIALWDVLAFCEREGSLDSNIKNEVPNDFEEFYNAHPQIQQVYFSSKNAEKYYDKHVGKNQDLMYHTLPSPSGANATLSFSQKLEIWKNILIL